MRSPRADHELLERISEVSGGISVDSRRVDEVVAAIGSALPGAGAGGVRHEPVWDSGAFLALIILLLSAEWWLSRR